jgi:hypothetical protein
MKKKIYGTIVCGGSLNGFRAELVRQNVGGFLVRLVSDRGCWAAGDLVQVGTGEFKKEVKYYLVTFRDGTTTTVQAVSAGEARSKAINWYRSVHNTGCPIGISGGWSGAQLHLTLIVSVKEAK